MSGLLYFDLAEALRIAEETVAAPAHGVGGPCLVWAKDAGTYLMSNAIPRPANDVIYARAHHRDGLVLREPDRTSGVNAERWDEVWDETRRICGGDDFAEFFELSDLLPVMREGARLGDTWLIFIVTPASVTFETGR